MKDPTPPECRFAPAPNPPSERELEILRTAIRLFAKKGYSQTEVQDIADNVGVGKGTIYRHFTSKENLFLAAARFAREQVMDSVDKAACTSCDPLDHWRRGIRAFLRFFDENPDVVELLIEERALTKGQRVATFFEKTGARSERWRGVFQRLMNDGILRELPLEQIEQAISSFLFGTLFVNYFAGRPEPLEGQFENMFDILLRGLQATR